MEAATVAPPQDEVEPQDPEAEGYEGDEEEDEEIVVEGEVAQLSLGIGGRKPTISRLKLAGGEFDVSGQYEKGARVRLLVEGTFDKIEVQDHRDRKSGEVTGIVRRHVLTVENVEKL